MFAKSDTNQNLTPAPPPQQTLYLHYALATFLYH